MAASGYKLDEFSALCAVARRGSAIDAETVLGIFIANSAKTEAHAIEAERRMIAAARIAGNESVVRQLLRRSRNVTKSPDIIEVPTSIIDLIADSAVDKDATTQDATKQDVTKDVTKPIDLFTDVTDAVMELNDTSELDINKLIIQIENSVHSIPSK